MTTTTSTPPSPRRCLRIMQAHHLDCQGLRPQQIADQLGCSRSTVYVYFRDFQLHRSHILQTVAADRLADQVHVLTQPETEPEQHRQHIATARELRLLLTALPGLEQQEREQREQDEAERAAAVIALARSRHFWAGEDGHVRYFGGDSQDQCTPDCPMCRPDLYEGDDPIPPIRDLDDRVDARRRLQHLWDKDKADELGTTRTEPEPVGQIQEESGQNQTNLDEIGHSEDENPVPDEEFVPEPPNFPENPPPRKPVGRQYPVSWDNPFGYIPKTNLVYQTTYSPRGGYASDHPPRLR